MPAAGAAQLYAGGLDPTQTEPGGQRRLLFPARPDLRDLHLRYWHGFCLR